MSNTRILQYFFIIAAVVSILDGAFSLQPAMQSIKYILLIFSGIIVGSLIHKGHSKIFISGFSYMFGVFLMWQFLGDILFLNGLLFMLINFAVFVAVILMIIGLEQFVSLVTLESKNNSKKTVENKSQKKYLRTMNHPEFEKIWSVLIVIAVGFTFVIILSELFFNIGRLAKIFYVLDVIITIIFIIDVVILYLRSKNFDEFIRKNIFDIISAIPAVGILRGLKLIRVIRIIKVTKLTKTVKLLKINKSTKFFSKESDFNNLESKKIKKRKS